MFDVELGKVTVALDVSDAVAALVAIRENTEPGDTEGYEERLAMANTIAREALQNIKLVKQ